MIFSLEGFFPFVIEYASAFYFAICIILWSMTVSKKEEYLPFRKARSCIATSYLVMGVNLLVWLFFTNRGMDSWEVLNPYVKFSDFIFFYIGTVFFSYGFTFLIDPHYFSKAKKLRDTLIFWSAILEITLSVQFDEYAFSVCFTILAFVTFVTHMSLFVFRFYRLYDLRRKELENYFPEDMQPFIFWLKKSIFLLNIMFVLGCMTLIFGIVFNYLCQVYIISVNFYIACSFINYSSLYGKLLHANVTEEDRENAAREEQKIAMDMEAYEKQFGQKLARWMEEKKFLDSQVTIDDLATEMGTNKLYMSRYINRKYKVNFSSLVTRLRLSEAKEYMLQNPYLKQEEVALHSGFSSSSYFSKVFSREEGITPVLWRKQQIQAE